MRYRVYVKIKEEIPTYGSNVLEKAVLEFEAYDFSVNGSAITAFPYGRELTSMGKGCLRPSIDIQIPGHTTFVIKDNHGRIAWDESKKM